MLILLFIPIVASILLVMKRNTHLITGLNMKLKSLFSPSFWEKLSSFLIPLFQRLKLSGVLHQVPREIMSLDQNIKFSSEETEFLEEKEVVSLLDLPELTLECILDRLSPSGLSSMAGVCNYLRERCTSDHVWEKNMKQKWGRVIGDAAHREWQCQIALRKRERMKKHVGKKNGVLEFIRNVLVFSWIRPKLESNQFEKKRSPISLPMDSIMTWYLSLEKGEFWFPAQVYNRENGNAGFMLSCYDAELSYDSRADTFQARYPSLGGRGTVEENISWDRIRTPPVGTPPYELHVSDCLNDLKPGDHIEIQWRKSKEFPYGWWYGVVGHLEVCSGSENHCYCCYSDAVKLEFNQYPLDSRWRQTEINRRNHREEGNEVGGFYGGIRKLYRNEEIAMWKSLWPTQILE